MARFQNDPLRVNRVTTQTGREFYMRLAQRAQVVLNNLVRLLPSNYTSQISGPNYTIELKTMATELARIELALEDIDADRDFDTLRSDFLYSALGSLIFVNGRLPKLEWSDEEFRKFCLNLIRIYFKGSTPQAMEEVVRLLLSDAQVTENFLLLRKKADGYDISDQFGFQADASFSEDSFIKEDTIRLLLDILRPAHTLFKLRYIFQDTYLPDSTITDEMQWDSFDYYYEDVRSYWAGIRNRDRLGKKLNIAIVDEDHSQDF